MPQLTPGSIRRLAEAERRVRQLVRGPDAVAQPNVQQVPEVQDLQVTGTSTTPGPGSLPMYPGQILDFSVDTGADTQLAGCWILSRNGGTLSAGKVMGRRWGIWTDNLPIFRVDDAGVIDPLSVSGSGALVLVTGDDPATDAVTLDSGEVVYPGYIAERDPATGDLVFVEDCWVRGENPTYLLLVNGAYSGIVTDPLYLAEVMYHNKSARVSGGVTNVAFSVASTGPNRLIVVAVEIESVGETVSGITYDGKDLTFLVAQNTTTTTFGRVEIWYGTGEGLGLDPGTYNVVATLTGASNFDVTAVTFRGVDQDDPVHGAASAQATDAGSGTASLAITSTCDGAIIYAAIVSNDTAITAGQDVQNQTTGAAGSGSDETFEQTSAGSKTMTYTDIASGKCWAMAGMAIRPALTKVVLVQETLNADYYPSSPTTNKAVRQIEVDDSVFLLSAGSRHESRKLGVQAGLVDVLTPFSAAEVVLLSTDQTISSATPTAIIYDSDSASTAFDPDNYWDSATKLVAPADGYYLVGANAYFEISTPSAPTGTSIFGELLYLAVQKNGAGLYLDRNDAQLGGVWSSTVYGYFTSWSTTLSMIVQLDEGDYVEVIAYQNISWAPTVKIKCENNGLPCKFWMYKCK